ncbi:MAG: single-stranded DNA-binding protein [Bdellovibrionota bacterium]|nr:single-stranded DNA-binding protein [Pseudomonadota bacterium]MDY6091541.1 single-stranded DNA-binding protein [Bdellovibrionota bacterium]
MGVNKVILLGRLGQDPDLKYSASQYPVARFSLATGERKKDSASGNWVEHTEWHNIVTFAKTAENCSKFLKKGSEVYIEGKLQTRKWQDKEGKDRYTTEIIANTVQFVGAKASASSNASYDAVQDASQNNYLDSLASADSLEEPISATFDDDDIPF